MGDVCDKFFLVVFGTGDFAGHIGEGGGQIADFILAVHLKFVMHIAAGILFGSLRDFAEREVHDLRKKYKDKGSGIYERQREIRKRLKMAGEMITEFTEGLERARDRQEEKTERT